MNNVYWFNFLRNAGTAHAPKITDNEAKKVTDNEAKKVTH